jgi:hypothetical protein
MTDKEKKSELMELVARAHRIQLGNKKFPPQPGKLAETQLDH